MTKGFVNWRDVALCARTATRNSIDSLGLLAELPPRLGERHCVGSVSQDHLELRVAFLEGKMMAESKEEAL